MVFLNLVGHPSLRGCPLPFASVVWFHHDSSVLFIPSIILELDRLYLNTIKTPSFSYHARSLDITLRSYSNIMPCLDRPRGRTWRTRVLCTHVAYKSLVLVMELGTNVSETSSVPDVKSSP
jgi:hypothetical protein